MTEKPAELPHIMKLLGRGTRHELPMFEKYSPLNVTLCTGVNLSVKWRCQ